jgi:hypothetical protein
VPSQSVNQKPRLRGLNTHVSIVGWFLGALIAFAAGVGAYAQQCPTCPTPAPTSPWQNYRDPRQGAQETPEPNTWPTSSRRKLVVGLPKPSEQASGELRIEPNVRIATAPLAPPLPESPIENQQWISEPLPPDTELLPPPNMQLGDFYEPPAEPVFGQMLEAEGVYPANLPPALGPLERLFGPRSFDGGIGQERVMLAPFEIDASSPQNQYRFRIDSVWGFPKPDRAELLFAKPGKGPAAEPSIDFQDLRAMFEVGSPSFSVGTDIPIRILDREFGGNTAGLGDMNVTTKLVLLDGKEIQLTQIFRTYMNTGAASKGLGNGHVSLEPGILARYKWSDNLYWHGQVKYWFPVGSDPAYSGQVLNYGLGWSHVLYENDTFALLDTMEFVAWSVLDGQQFDFALGEGVDIDGETALRVFPGLRFVFDHGGDLGVSELGISGSFRTGGDDWFDGMLRLEARWVY